MPIGRYEPMADGTDMRADMESGTCPSGTDEPPGKATFIATLRCKIVAGQAAHKLADALPADIRKSGHGQQSVAPLAALAPQLPAHRAGLSPTAPRGHNRPGAVVPERATSSCPSTAPSSSSTAASGTATAVAPSTSNPRRTPDSGKKR